MPAFIPHLQVENKFLVQYVGRRKVTSVTFSAAENNGRPTKQLKFRSLHSPKVERHSGQRKEIGYTSCRMHLSINTHYTLADAQGCTTSRTSTLYPCNADNTAGALPTTAWCGPRASEPSLLSTQLEESPINLQITYWHTRACAHSVSTTVRPSQNTSVQDFNSPHWKASGRYVFSPTSPKLFPVRKKITRCPKKLKVCQVCMRARPAERII